MNNKDLGFGDTIKRITTWLGITQCTKCKERQQILNKLFPYKNKILVMTEEQIEIIEHYIDDEPTKITCKVLNDLRKSIDGVWIDSCFCTKTQRKAFLNDFRNWYIDVKKNK